MANTQLPPSTTPNYLLDCPDCGQQLSSHVGTPESTPWICNVDNVGFWVSELGGLSRSRYKGKLNWGYGDHNKVIRSERQLEYLAAVSRGTSAREDQLSILSIEQLKHIMARKKVDPEFMKKVEAEHGRRGVK